LQQGANEIFDLRALHLRNNLFFYLLPLTIRLIVVDFIAVRSIPTKSL
jgi:hypothetical protein